MPLPPPPSIPEVEWNIHKVEILELYPILKRKELLEHLKNKHGFCPTVAQYERQKKKWRLSKNVTREQWTYILDQACARSSNNKATEIWVHNRLVHPKQLRKAARWVGATPATLRHPKGKYNSSGTARNGIRVSTPEMGPCVVENLDTPFAQFETLLDQYLEKYRLPMPGADSSPTTVVGRAGFNDTIPEQLQDAEFNSELINFQIVPQGSLRSAHQHDFGRVGRALLRECLGRGIGDPNSPEYPQKIMSLLRTELVERRRGEFDNYMAKLPLASDFELPFQLLRYPVYLCSNNLLSPLDLDDLFLWIVDNDRLSVIEVLVALRCPTTDTFASALLNCAVRLPSSDIARKLLRMGADPNFKGSAPFDAENTLDAAIRVCDTDLVCLLVENGGRTYLESWEAFLAQKCDSCSSATYRKGIQFLIDNGVNAHRGAERATDPETILHRVIKSGDLEAVTMLLLAGTSVNNISEYSATPLQVAAGYGHLEVVELLVGAGADIDAPMGSAVMDKGSFEHAQTCSFLTPLQIALALGKTDVAYALLRHGADIDGLNVGARLPSWKEEAVYVARLDSQEIYDCSSDHMLASPKFWDHYAGVQRCRCRRRGLLNSPLQTAAARRDLRMVRRLLSLGASLDIPGGYGTALQVAASQEGNFELVKLLLDKGADINAPAQDPIGRTALQAAILYGDKETVHFLLESGADINSGHCAVEGYRALQAAVRRNDIILAKLLVLLGADVNAEASSIRGATCLQIASQLGNIQMVNLLLRHGADVNAEASSISGATCLQIASQLGNKQLVNLLLRHGADPNAPPSQTGGGLTALQAAVGSRKTLVTQAILDYGGDPNMLGNGLYGSKTCALLLSIQKRQHRVTKLLLDHEANPNNLADKSNILAAAICEEQLQDVQILIKHGADVHALHPGDGRSMLQLAAAVGSVPLCRVLIEAGLDLEGSNGTAALYSAAEKRRVEVVKFLFSEGVNPNWDTGQKSEYSARLCSPISKVFSNSIVLRVRQEDLLEILNVMLCHGAWFNSSDEIAEEVCHLPWVMTLRLMEAGLHHAVLSPVNASSLLHYASRNGLHNYVKLLLDGGADADVLSKTEGSALQAAVEKRHTDIVELLLSKGANVNLLSNDPSSSTALQSAVNIGSLPLVHLLLKAGADVNAALPDHKHTALKAAARYGRLDIAYILLMEDKDPETLHTRCAEAAELAESEYFPRLAKMLLDWNKHNEVS